MNIKGVTNAKCSTPEKTWNEKPQLGITIRSQATTVNITEQTTSLNTHLSKPRKTGRQQQSATHTAKFHDPCVACWTTVWPWLRMQH